MAAPTREYPTQAPPDTPVAQRKANMWRCGFCASGLHPSCPRAVRLPKYGLWVCYCCGTDDVRCLECGSTEEVDKEVWRCIDRQACRHQVEVRQANSPIWNMLQKARLAGAAERRRKREQTARIWRDVPHNEDEMLEEERQQLAAAKRAGPGSCECCGHPTKGGRFLPGHDAKLKSRLRRLVLLANDQDAQRELVERGWA